MEAVSTIGCMSALGDRLGDARRRRGFTQEQLAERSEVSVSTIRKLERGERDAARMVTVSALAGALGTPTSALLEEPAPPKDEPSTIDLGPLRAALTPVGKAEVAASPDDVAVLRRDYEDVYARYERNEFAATAAAVPGLIERTRAIHEADRAEAGETGRLLAYVWHLAGSLLTQLRQYDLAFFPLREAVTLARRGGHTIAEASIATGLAWLLMEQGRLRDTKALAVATADRIEPRMSRATAEELNAWGRLLLFGSGAAIRNNEPQQAKEILRLADSAAATLGGRRPRWSIGPFDRVVVARRQVENAVVLGEYHRALHASRRVPDSDADTTANRNRFLLDVARAHAGRRNYIEAFDTLRVIRRGAPEWLREQQYARDVVTQLLTSRARPVTDDARELADLLGLA